MVVVCATEAHCLSVPAIAFYEYFGFTGEGFAELSGMTKLWAEMMAIFPLLVAHLAAGTWFMGDLAGVLVALQIAFVTAWEQELAFVQAKGLSSACC